MSNKLDLYFLFLFCLAEGEIRKGHKDRVENLGELRSESTQDIGCEIPK